MVALAKAGVSVPLEMVRLLRSALLLAARVTAMLYVLVAVVSAAVTTTVIVLLPTASAIAPDGLPLATVAPFTFTVAPASATAGVTVSELTLLATEAV